MPSPSIKFLVSRGRKSSRGALSAGGALDLSFNYIARTPEHKAKIVAKLSRAPAGVEFQIDSLDTGWSSGRIALKDGASLELSLSKPGDNTFKVFVFDSNGAPVALGEDKIIIARTAASIDAIPASHSIGVEVRDKVGDAMLDYLVHEGDQLPKKGKNLQGRRIPSSPVVLDRTNSSCGRARSLTRSVITVSSACSKSRGRILMTA